MCMALPGVIDSVVNEEGSISVPHDTVIDEVRKVADKSMKKKWNWGNMALLCGIVIIVIFIAGGDFGFIVRKYTISSSSVQNEVTLVALTDLHGRTIGREQERLVKKVAEQQPDVIVYLGDMIDKADEKDVQALVTLTEKLREQAPIYYVEGNHETESMEEGSSEEERQIYQQLQKELAEAGAVLLSGDSASLSIGQTRLNFCGIRTHYWWTEEDDAAVAELKSFSGVNVLLCHYPESVLWYEAFADGGLDLALCGHTHGGLIRIPFKGGVYAPEQGYWPMYDMGEYPVYEDTAWRDYGGAGNARRLGTMIISSGLSGERGIPRINNPMEVTVVHIVP